MSPTPTFKFFFFASSASASILRVLGPSTEIGFSMKTLRPRSIASRKKTQRKAGGVAMIATSPGQRQSMAFLYASKPMNLWSSETSFTPVTSLFSASSSVSVSQLLSIFS